VPNTSVDWSAALYGGIVGGCLWLLNSILNALNLSKVASMSAIYGPLGIIPIFLIGLYFSWLIVLFGAQVAYAAQNRSVYLQEKKAESVHQQGREFVALRIMTLVGRAFLRGEPPRPAMTSPRPWPCPRDWSASFWNCCAPTNWSCPCPSATIPATRPPARSIK